MSAKRKRVYIYPITSRGKDESSNPYIDNLCNSLTSRYIIINQHKPSNSGILQIFRFFFKTDIVYFNWVENLPDRTGGFLQSFLLIQLLYLCKITGKKVVWTMHNKISHSKKNLKLKEYVFKKLLRLSDLVITHSREGLTYADMFTLKHHMIYFPHPVLELDVCRNIPTNTSKVYDVVIWGLMTPYKGLSLFLKYLYDNKIDRFKILIAGKFVSEEYYNEVSQYKTEHIIIRDQFVRKDELSSLIGQAKATLFTYQGTSVLSSGVLMDTLTYRSIIIAPHVGAFKDLSEDGLLFTYSGFDQLIVLLDQLKQDKIDIDKHNIDNFLNSITWNQFADFFQQQIEKK